MKKFFSNIVGLVVLLFLMAIAQSCCIHLWPDPKEETTNFDLTLTLRFHPDMYVWEHIYNASDQTVTQRFPDEAVSPEHPGTTDIYDNTIISGVIRHKVRIYPAGEPYLYLREIEIDANIDGSYDCDIPLQLPEGVYDVAVWSDPVNNADKFFHDPSDFLSVNLNENNKANSDSKDAFSGLAQIIVENISGEQNYVVEMTRPYSKFELIATDVKDFIDRENTRFPRGQVDISNYKVVFTYPNFMPSSYSVIDDRLVDSRAGMAFETNMSYLNDSEVSLGFDYVMINSVENPESSQGISVVVTVFDAEGTQVANSAPIRVPLRRDDHTVVRSPFLSENSQGGVAIDPDYDGDHNIIM